MEEFIARHALGALWGLIWHFGIMVGVLICACLWAYAVPFGKKAAEWVAFAACVCLVCGATYTELGARYVQAKWDAEKAEGIRLSEKARRDAEAWVPPVVPGAPVERLCNDAADRDNANGKCDGQGVQNNLLLKFWRHR